MKSLSARVSAMETLAREADDAERALQGAPGVRRICIPTKVYRALLLKLDGTILLNGKLWTIEGKSKGAGVYQVWLEVSK